MEERKMKKEDKHKSQSISAINLANLKTYKNVEHFGSNRSRDNNLIAEKEKWTNEENDRQEKANSLLHNITRHIQHLYQISKLWVW